jgi:hypothetical protein
METINDTARRPGRRAQVERKTGFTNSINRGPDEARTTLSSVMKYYTTTTEFNCGIDLHARLTASTVASLEKADAEKKSPAWIMARQRAGQKQR